MRIPSAVSNPNFKHGHASAAGSTRTYGIWQAMRNRCRNPNVAGYENYGGRGIVVCDRWRNFKIFLEDMGEAPPGYSLDRIDNDGHYYPANCRWADRRTQRLNSRAARKIVFSGKTQTIDEWSKELGVNYMTLYSRLVTYGWPVERAMNEGIR